MGVLRKARAYDTDDAMLTPLELIGSMGLYCYNSKIFSHLCDSSRRSLGNSGLILSSLVRSQLSGADVVKLVTKQQGLSLRLPQWRSNLCHQGRRGPQSRIRAWDKAGLSEPKRGPE